MGTPSVRPAAVAGLFYPGERDALARSVDDLLEQAAASTTSREHRVEALIVPHAGYVYSGLVAARGFQALGSLRGIDTVVLIGPAHRTHVRGIAHPGAAALQTPLGAVSVALDVLDAAPEVHADPAAHAREHAIEVELPFLQRLACGELRVVPLCVGRAAPEEVAGTLERLLDRAGRERTLLVVSSDLSHFHAYDEAREIDEATADHILALDPDITHEDACGATPVAALLHIARRRGLRPELVDIRNSGDTTGDRERVVGYASFAFGASSPTNPQEKRPT